MALTYELFQYSVNSLQMVCHQIATNLILSQQLKSEQLTKTFEVLVS